MIVAVSSVKDEVEIVRQTVTHLLGSGVDEVIVSDGGSTDGTRDVLRGLCTVVSQDGPFDQGKEVTRLAFLAQAEGADWVIPFDADEFWCAPKDTTIDKVLAELPLSTVTLSAIVYPHLSRDIRCEVPKFWGKMCFRPSSTMQVAWGNHGVNGLIGDPAYGMLEIRELQYRSLDHFRAKVAKARALFESWDVPHDYGSHMRRLTTMTDDELEAEYVLYCDVPTVFDPIPYRGVSWTS